jgi:hypothetical protein
MRFSPLENVTLAVARKPLQLARLTVFVRGLLTLVRDAFRVSASGMVFIMEQPPNVDIIRS